MIWFDIGKLESKISNNELTDKDGFKYVLAYTILITIMFSFITNNSNGWTNLSECIISVLITIWGFNAIYAANDAIDGKDFFKRFFSISWVIGLRLLVVTLILALVIGVVIAIPSVNNGMNLTEPDPIKDIVGLIIMAIYSVINYLLIINSFRRLKTI